MGDVVIRAVTVEDVPAVVGLVRTVLAEIGLGFGEGSETDRQVLALPGSYTDAGGAFVASAIKATSISPIARATNGGTALATCVKRGTSFLRR